MSNSIAGSVVDDNGSFKVSSVGSPSSGASRSVGGPTGVPRDVVLLAQSPGDRMVMGQQIGGGLVVLLLIAWPSGSSSSAGYSNCSSSGDRLGHCTQRV